MIEVQESYGKKWEFSSDKQDTFPAVRAVQKWNARTLEIVNSFSVELCLTKLNGSDIVEKIPGCEWIVGWDLLDKMGGLQTSWFPDAVTSLIKNLKIDTFQLLRIGIYQNYLI